MHHQHTTCAFYVQQLSRKKNSEGQIDKSEPENAIYNTVARDHQRVKPAPMQQARIKQVLPE
jgi:hypothetical protein